MAPSSFEHISRAAIAVLARQSAIRLAKSELARQGLRVTSVPMRELHIRADQLLAEQPDLFAQAAERVAAHPEWLPKRARPPVSKTESASAGTEMIGDFRHRTGDFHSA
jgi:hypothetical protein